MTQPDIAELREDTAPQTAPREKRRRRWIVHVVLWPLLALLIVGGGFAAWSLYSDATSVRDDLEDARAAVQEFQSAAAERRLADLPAIAERLEASAQAAVEPTSQPLWRMGEVIPVVGENFRAVRVIAEGVDDISTEVVTPASSLLGTFTFARDPATGGFDVAPLRQATEIATNADRVITELHEQVRSIDTDATIGQVGGAVDQFDELLAKAEETIPPMNAALAGISSLLGMDGQKDVVLAFLNNAEAMPLGGGPASQTLLSVENGTVQITRQVSSGDFPTAIPVNVPVDDSAIQLYDSLLVDASNAATSRPDFPTAGKIIAAHWERAFGITPDVVVSIDPIGLSRLLKVTGPVSMPDGEQITSENAVSKLLNEAYFRFPYGEGSDEYFATAASAIFDRIMSVDYDVWAMAQALTDTATKGSLMMWSADPATQAMFDGTRLQGTLPKGNEEATVVGVYFRDRSTSKIDYYLNTAATVTTNTCTPSAPTYTVEVRLDLDIPPDLKLPAYIVSSEYDFYRTEVFLYGPAGASLTSAEVPEAGLQTVPGASVVDLSRPAQKFVVDLVNGQSAVVRATFTGAPGTAGPTEVRTTPMIRSTEVTVSEAECG
ncbi:DUF4012 domain-containing protein [Agromyces sp. Soil535]|uniref:DUF4012 domain-containing protein n=1 Tax=Agromyces sp. Soil535 TaxID=1736390 RepID=UPI0006FF2C0C|nr:DUF4012 domain-containing protein [Agromyces sp. Soil535]KRE25921.1 hypothetical protein ASG80_03560 [Agromyces sp. Soil535]